MIAAIPIGTVQVAPGRPCALALLIAGTQVEGAALATAMSGGDGRNWYSLRNAVWIAVQEVACRFTSRNLAKEWAVAPATQNAQFGDFCKNLMLVPIKNWSQPVNRWKRLKPGIFQERWRSPANRTGRRLPASLNASGFAVFVRYAILSARTGQAGIGRPARRLL